MSEQYRIDPVADPMLSETQPTSFPQRSNARHLHEPAFTGLDVLAFAVTLIMVCGPLAMGAFRL